MRGPRLTGLAMLLAIPSLAAASGGDGGLAELMGVIGQESSAQTNRLCQGNSLALDLQAQESALAQINGMGCKALGGRLERLDALAAQAGRCGSDELASQARQLGQQYRAAESGRCHGNTLNGVGQAIGVAGIGMDILKLREQEKAEQRKRRQQAARYLDRSVNPNSLTYSASALQNWQDITTTAVDGTPVLQVCIRDHECEDGDILNVWVNGRVVIADELRNTASCTLERVPAGHNRIQVFAPNGTGYKGQCSFADANTGEISVSGVDSAMNPINTQRQQWQLRSKAGSSSSINVYVR